MKTALIGNKIVDHSDVVGASPDALLQLHLHSRLNTWLQWNRPSVKDNCKTRQNTFKFWNLECLILEVWLYSGYKRECTLTRCIVQPAHVHDKSSIIQQIVVGSTCQFRWSFAVSDKLLWQPCINIQWNLVLHTKHFTINIVHLTETLVQIN